MMFAKKKKDAIPNITQLSDAVITLLVPKTVLSSLTGYGIKSFFRQSVKAIDSE